MPIYEYRCEACDNRFELLQRFSDPAVETCPTCSGAVQKLISRSAFHLKGSGWYVTDYGRNGSADGTKADKDSTDSNAKKSNESDSNVKSSNASSSDAASSSSSSDAAKSTTAAAAAAD
jgi:putative FmdB family regulatory protein